MNKLFQSIIILLHLTSCGVKGDLYLPQEDPKNSSTQEK